MDFLDTPEKKERRLVHVPMGRFGEAIEQANAALFRESSHPFLSLVDRDQGVDEKKTPGMFCSVASDESSFITGTDFAVDGGVSSAYVVRYVICATVLEDCGLTFTVFYR